MKVLLALSLLLNFGLVVWVAGDMSRQVASSRSSDLGYRLEKSLERQARGLRSQVALRDSLANSNPAWLASAERRDMLERAMLLDSEARAAGEGAMRMGLRRGPSGD